MASNMNGSEYPNKDIKWIQNFLQWSYFGTFCSIHGKALSIFCTTCEAPLCAQCVNNFIDQDHEDHSIIQISSFEDKEAVKSSLISKHILCHDIQPYICNRTAVMMLHPLLSLEDSTSSNSSGERYSWGISKTKQCDLCGEKLNSADQSVRFCSIYCKVTAYEHSTDGSIPTLFVDPDVENVVDANRNISMWIKSRQTARGAGKGLLAELLSFDLSYSMIS